MTGIVTAMVGTNAGIYAKGWYRSTYTGYFADNVNYFDGATPTASVVDVSPISLASVLTTTSYQWLGYWFATADTISAGNTTLRLTSDDASYMWVGDNALSGYTTLNAVIDNGGTHAATSVAGSYAMTAGTYYPIRIQYGNNAGSGSFQFDVFSNSLGNYTTTVTNNIFYNFVTNGF